MAANQPAASRLSDDIWQQAISDKAGALNLLVLTSDAKTVTYEKFQQSLLDLQRRHASRRSTRLFAKLAPIIEHLRVFSAAIGVFTQSNPEITCLVEQTAPYPHAANQS
jgi:hypothetical protein